MGQTKTAASNIGQGLSCDEEDATPGRVFEELIAAPAVHVQRRDDGGPEVLLGTCVEPPNVEHPGTCTVRLQQADEDRPELQVPYLETVSPQKNQLVLL